MRKLGRAQHGIFNCFIWRSSTPDYWCERGVRLSNVNCLSFLIEGGFVICIPSFICNRHQVVPFSFQKEDKDKAKSSQKSAFKQVKGLKGVLGGKGSKVAPPSAIGLLAKAGTQLAMGQLAGVPGSSVSPPPGESRLSPLSGSGSPPPSAVTNSEPCDSPESPSFKVLSVEEATSDRDAEQTSAVSETVIRPEVKGQTISEGSQIQKDVRSSHVSSPVHVGSRSPVSSVSQDQAPAKRVTSSLDQVISGDRVTESEIQRKHPETTRMVVSPLSSPPTSPVADVGPETAVVRSESRIHSDPDVTRSSELSYSSQSPTLSGSAATSPGSTPIASPPPQLSSGATSPVLLGSTSPASPGTTTPVLPGATSPLSRGTTSPLSPGATTPVLSGATSPLSPGTTTPVSTPTSPKSFVSASPGTSRMSTPLSYQTSTPVSGVSSPMSSSHVSSPTSPGSVPTSPASPFLPISPPMSPQPMAISVTSKVTMSPVSDITTIGLTPVAASPPVISSPTMMAASAPAGPVMVRPTMSSKAKVPAQIEVEASKTVPTQTKGVGAVTQGDSNASVSKLDAAKESSVAIITMETASDAKSPDASSSPASPREISTAATSAKQAQEKSAPSASVKSEVSETSESWDTGQCVRRPYAKPHPVEILTQGESTEENISQETGCTSVDISAAATSDEFIIPSEATEVSAPAKMIKAKPDRNLDDTDGRESTQVEGKPRPDLLLQEDVIASNVSKPASTIKDQSSLPKAHISQSASTGTSQSASTSTSQSASTTTAKSTLSNTPVSTPPSTSLSETATRTSQPTVVKTSTSQTSEIKQPKTVQSTGIRQPPLSLITSQASAVQTNTSISSQPKPLADVPSQPLLSAANVVVSEAVGVSKPDGSRAGKSSVSPVQAPVPGVKSGSPRSGSSLVTSSVREAEQVQMTGVSKTSQPTPKLLDGQVGTPKTSPTAKQSLPQIAKPADTKPVAEAQPEITKMPTSQPTVVSSVGASQGQVPKASTGQALQATKGPNTQSQMCKTGEVQVLPETKMSATQPATLTGTQVTATKPAVSQSTSSSKTVVAQEIHKGNGSSPVQTAKMMGSQPQGSMPTLTEPSASQQKAAVESAANKPGIPKGAEGQVLSTTKMATTQPQSARSSLTQAAGKGTGAQAQTPKLLPGQAAGTKVISPGEKKGTSPSSSFPTGAAQSEEPATKKVISAGQETSVKLETAAVPSNVGPTKSTASQARTATTVAQQGKPGATQSGSLMAQQGKPGATQSGSLMAQQGKPGPTQSGSLMAQQGKPGTTQSGSLMAQQGKPGVTQSGSNTSPTEVSGKMQTAAVQKPASAVPPDHKHPSLLEKIEPSSEKKILQSSSLSKDKSANEPMGSSEKKTPQGQQQVAQGTSVHQLSQPKSDAVRLPASPSTTITMPKVVKTTQLQSLDKQLGGSEKAKQGVTAPVGTAAEAQGKPKQVQAVAPHRLSSSQVPDGGKKTSSTSPTGATTASTKAGVTATGLGQKKTAAIGSAKVANVNTTQEKESGGPAKPSAESGKSGLTKVQNVMPVPGVKQTPAPKAVPTISAASKEWTETIPIKLPQQATSSESRQKVAQSKTEKPSLQKNEAVGSTPMPAEAAKVTTRGQKPAPLEGVKKTATVAPWMREPPTTKTKVSGTSLRSYLPA